MKCDQCQTENKEGAKFCAKCGRVLPAMSAKATAETKHCPKCGKALKLDAKFCGGCGHKVEQTTAAQEPTLEIAVPKPVIKPVVQPETQASPPIQTIEQTKPELALEPANTCPKCGKPLKLEAKFCGGCGHKFEQALSAHEQKVEIAVNQPDVLLIHPEIKTTPPVKMVEQVKREPVVESNKPCPKCGKALKWDAKFCGGCGHNFMQETAAAILEPKATTVNRTETKSVPAEIILASQPEKNVEQAKPKNMPENVQAEKSGNKFKDVSKVKKGLPIVVIAGGIGAVVAIIAGGGFFYYKSHSGQAVAAKVEQVPSVLSQPASAQAPVAVIPPSSVPASSPALVSVVAPVQTVAPVVPPVVEPVTPPATPVASRPKNPVVHAKQKGETQDDKKLLNAIDQYMDKQK